MFAVQQCRRLPNETTTVRPTAARCGCANRTTGDLSNTRIVRAINELPECGQSKFISRKVLSDTENSQIINTIPVNISLSQWSLFIHS